MEHRHRYAVRALWSLAVMLFAISAFAADPDATGLVPTIWFDFETQPSTADLAAANKGSASVSFKDEGTKSYKGGAIGGYALDTSKFTSYTEAGSFSTAGQPFTISLVMNLGTTANGVTLSVRNETGQKDLIVRRGTTAGSLVVGCDTWNVATKYNLETSLGSDSAWHLVSIVVKETGVSLYVDGDFVSSMTDYTLWSATGYVSRFQFGSHLSGLQGDEVKGGGLIDDLRIHNGALTSAQMKYIAVEYGIVPTVDMLSISGSPQDWGVVVPDYGVTNGLSQGDVIACSASGSETTTTKLRLLGYSLYSVAADGTKTLVEENAATSLTYTHGTTGAHLVWNWAHSNFVSVATSDGGTVSAGDWVGYGDSFTVTATPYSGYKFNRWTGDTAGIDVTSASIVLASVTAPRTLTATFLNENIDETVQWVSTGGNDEKDGYSELTPKKTIAAAVAWLRPVAQTKACTVHVAPGLYSISSPIVVTNAISVIGDDPDPSRTVVSNADRHGDWGVTRRVFTINHADAFVANLTMQSGYMLGSDSGGNFSVGSAGGTVSNCVIEAGDTRGNTYAAGARLSGGLVTHTIFRKNNCGSGMGNWQGQHGAVLELSGSSRAENCLLVDNPPSGTVYLSLIGDSAVMRNCTIADTGLSKTNEYCKVFTAIRINSSKATVLNTVIAGVTNTIDGAACPPSGSVAKFQNGAFDGDVTGLPAGTITGTAATFFKKYEEGDYRPKTGGVLVNKGQSYEPLPAKDLGGNKRLIGRAIDIGCYEAHAAELRIRVR